MPDEALPHDPASLQSYYDELYTGAYMTEHSPLELERVMEVLDAIPPETVGTILDFGCGRGAWILALQQKFPHALICGVDVSPVAVEGAAIAFPSATFAAFDGREAPYNDRAFDLVFSYHVLEHVLVLEETVTELSRLAGRWICVCLPCRNPGSFEERNAALQVTPTGELSFTHDDDDHLRRVTSDEMAALFRSRGFTLCDAFFSNHLIGSIEFLLEAGPRVVHKVLGPRRWLARSILDAGHAVFLLHRFARLPRRSESRRRKAARVFLLVTKPLTAAVVMPVRRLTRREWRKRRRDPAGSNQYLVFARAEEEGR